MEPNLYSRLDVLTETIHNNHTEVVQRLTALETRLVGLPERVAALESEKAHLAGGRSVLGVVLSTVISLGISLISLFRKHY